MFTQHTLHLNQGVSDLVSILMSECKGLLLSVPAGRRHIHTDFVPTQILIFKNINTSFIKKKGFDSNIYINPPLLVLTRNVSY